MTQRAKVIWLILVFALWCVVVTIIIVTSEFREQFIKPVVTQSFDESDPRWIPRIGEHGARQELGECDQVDRVVGGLAQMHRIRCPGRL